MMSRGPPAALGPSLRAPGLRGALLPGYLERVTPRARPSRLLGLLVLGLCLAGPVPPLAADDWSEAKGDFRTLLRSDTWQVRRDAFLALTDYDGPDAVDEIYRAISREDSSAVIVAAIDVLALFESEGAVARILEEARSGKGELPFYSLLVLRKRATVPQGALELLVETMRGRDPIMAAQAVLVMGELKLHDARPHMVEALASEDPRMRAAGARALVALIGPEPPDPQPGFDAPPPKFPEGFDPKPLVQPLVRALEASEGSERRFLVAALERMTLEDFGFDPTAWKRLADGADPASIPRRPKALPYIMGVPVYGQRVVLFLDGTQCTDDAHPFSDRARLQELCEVPGARPVPWYELRTTRQFIDAHLTRVVRDLEGRKFDILSAGAKVDALFGRLKPVNASSIQRAIDFIEGVKISAELDAYGVLETALDIGGKRDSQAWTSGPDEIVYPSCQVPWLAELTDQDEIAARVGLKARRRMVPIITLGVGPHPFRMMVPLAEWSGGVYRDLQR